MSNSEPLTFAQKANFETLRRACEAEDLALVSCRDKATGKTVAVLCVMQECDDEIIMTPLARLFDGNPYDELEPPVPDEPGKGETR